MLRWFDAPLEQDFSSFRTRISNQLPAIYDTKYIASSGMLGLSLVDTALDQVYKALVLNTDIESISISYAEGFSICENSFHDAAYDAYCTGCIFAYQSEMTDVNPALNKLFMMQSLYHMDLSPSSHAGGFLKYTGVILHVCEFPSYAKTGDFTAPLHTAGYKTDSIEVIWIDDNGLFIHIETQKEPDVVIKSIIFPDIWRVRTFDGYISSRLLAAQVASTTAIATNESSFVTLCRSVSNTVLSIFKRKSTDDDVECMPPLKK